MTYYADLTPYTFLSETIAGGKQALNVGWLDGAHDFTTGRSPEHFAARLGTLCAEHAAARTRGLHACELCSAAEYDYPVVEHVDGVALTLGSAEIRVTDEAGTVLAAPNLVYHYVVRHGYLPPESFVEAVLALRVSPG